MHLSQADVQAMSASSTSAVNVLRQLDMELVSVKRQASPPCLSVCVLHSFTLHSSATALCGISSSKFTNGALHHSFLPPSPWRTGWVLLLL
ncbi:UNVERIFIED_CONTAM: hypothetical protein FKN15_016496 [Acipenser sinensis]